MHESVIAEKKRVFQVEETLDAPTFCELRERLDAAADAGDVLLDLRGVRTWDPFALAALCELVANSRGAIRMRGLCAHHEVLLGYLGLLTKMVLPDSPASDAALG
jgi:anti-anti-sigma regulatory factor